MRNLIKRFIYSPKFRYGTSFKGLSYNPREYVLDLAMRYVYASEMRGDYCEFGVYKGETFASAYHIAKATGNKMSFFAFDSFEGLPEIVGVDARFLQYRKGEFSASVRTFKESLKEKGVEPHCINTIKGWFKDLKNVSGLTNVSIAWIDCDLYESTVPVLNFLTDKLFNGSIIIFDDWNSFRGDPEKGERKAFAEWLEKNPNIHATEFHKFGWHGNSFIIHKNVA